MIPSADLIERWGHPTDDGYIAIPESAWPELLWVLRKAEEAEALLADVRTYLDRSFVSWPHQDTCPIKRKDLVARLKPEAAS